MGRLANISLKFMDIMIGVVLGLGFQWWPNLQAPWQYAAFIFVYIELVDYWIDYSSSLKKFPPKRELDIMLDVAVIFMMFLYIYSTQLSVFYFLLSFGTFKLIDTVWLLRVRNEYHPQGREGRFVSAWIWHNFGEILYTGILLLVATQYQISAPLLIGIFIVLRLVTRVLASLQYKEVYFT
ncbi:MAG: hypothetical protein UY78_C0013G0002 [Parcubacteria group bacterium GW2011_GWA1_53_13]|nr:MAG: hypothetical protein UY78_C0013G0002 [Parcubacteria group bacterium GW2011_GWA1_53_13]